MVLNGLENRIDQAFKINRKQRRTNIYHIHLVRYADDFVVTSSNRDVLEKSVKPLIAAFLKERGLELSEEKTTLSHISTGFNFLGQNLRKYSGVLLIKPSKKNVQTFLKKIQQIINQYRSATTVQLIYKLNPMIRGWAMYHRHAVASRTFAFVDYKIHWMLWKWAKKRHRNKGIRWIVKKYFIQHKGLRYHFHAFDEGHLITLFKAGSVSIQRHVKIRAEANPYDQEYEMYFEKRSDGMMLNKLYGRRKLTMIYKRQQGLCAFCNQRITTKSGWHAHHLTPKHLGGKATLENLVLLHPVCHRQVHSLNIQLPPPRSTKGR